jgi:hypothetical protein
VIAHKRRQFRESRRDIDRSAMRTFDGGDRKRELQLIDDLLQGLSRHGSNDRTAFVADKLGVVSANDPRQEATAFRIPNSECGSVVATIRWSTVSA